MCGASPLTLCFRHTLPTRPCAQAAYTGMDESKYPEFEDMHNRNLFVNWHPAPLGHEVIGNQVSH